jgi:hypothetical protein
MIWRTPTMRMVATNWLRARSAAPRALAIVPNGAVVRISDGVESADVAIWLVGRRTGGPLTRIRAIEPDPLTGPRRVDRTFASLNYDPLGVLHRPAFVPGAYPLTAGSSELLAYGANGTALSIRFVERTDVAASDWDWLTAPFEPAGVVEPGEEP